MNGSDLMEIYEITKISMVVVVMIYVLTGFFSGSVGQVNFSNIK